MRGRGIQSEVLTSLALVMVTAIGLLAAVFFEAHSNQLDRLVPLLGRALRDEGRASTVAYGDAVATATWFRVEPGASPKPHALTGAVLDEAGLALAEAAREKNEPLLRTGRPWEPIRFAMPLSGAVPGAVGVAVLRPSIEGRLVLLLVGVALIADGMHVHIPRGYIYFAMSFSFFVEMLNMRMRGTGMARSGDPRRVLPPGD